jgi:small redox-active disulfide protein 2
MTTMIQDDYCRIRVGEDQIGIRGLKGVIEEIAQSHRDKTDQEVQQALLDRLSAKNYIADSARDDYGKAFLREFSNFLGRPVEDVYTEETNILVLGPGCAQCNQLERLVKQVLSELRLGVSVEHVTDIKEMAKYGFVRTPALVINGKIVSMGTVPSAKKMKELLTAVCS